MFLYGLTFRLVLLFECLRLDCSFVLFFFSVVVDECFFVPRAADGEEWIHLHLYGARILLSVSLDDSACLCKLKLFFVGGILWAVQEVISEEEVMDLRTTCKLTTGRITRKK